LRCFSELTLGKSAAHSTTLDCPSFGQDLISRMLFGTLAMSPDQYTTSLKEMLFDLEDIGARLAQHDGIAGASDQAKHLAFALAAKASAIARDAVLIVTSSENSAVGSSNIQQRRTRWS
jgi:hypothetical protein